MCRGFHTLGTRIQTSLTRALVHTVFILYSTSFYRQQEKRNAPKSEVTDPKVEELRQKLEQRRAGILDFWYNCSCISCSTGSVNCRRAPFLLLPY
jgi:hypothetical protein